MRARLAALSSALEKAVGLVLQCSAALEAAATASKQPHHFGPVVLELPLLSHLQCVGSTGIKPTGQLSYSLLIGKLDM